MTILIQMIEVRWSKRSRGGPKASLRNSVPEVFPVPYFDVEADKFYMQRISCSEYSGFKPFVGDWRTVHAVEEHPHIFHPAETLSHPRACKWMHVNDFMLQMSGQTVSVQFRASKGIYNAGLELGNWIRIVADNRHYGRISFTRRVYNLAFVKAGLVDQPFKPDRLSQVIETV